MTSREILQRLGRGERIADVCGAANMNREQFDVWWREETQKRAVIGHPRWRGIGISRDERGVPGPRMTANEFLLVAHIRVATFGSLTTCQSAARVPPRAPLPGSP